MDLSALARRVVSGIGRPGGFLRWMRLTKPFLARNVLVGLRAIGRVGPHRARGVGLVEQPLAQPRALVGRRVGRVPAPDQPIFAVDRDVVLVAERRDGDVDRRHRPIRPRCLALVNLTVQRASRSLCRSLAGLGFPVLRNAALLDRLSSPPRCCAAWARRSARRRRSARPWRCSRPRAAPRRTGRTAA